MESGHHLSAGPGSTSSCRGKKLGKGPVICQLERRASKHCLVKANTLEFIYSWLLKKKLIMCHALKTSGDPGSSGTQLMKQHVFVWHTESTKAGLEPFYQSQRFSVSFCWDYISPTLIYVFVCVPFMAMCGLSVHWKKAPLAYLLNLQTDHTDSFKRLNLEHGWGHHFIFLKASWLHSKSTGINVINNYGLPCLTSHYLSFPDVLCLSCLHLFLGWVRQTGV